MLRVIRHKASALVIADSAQRIADMRIENAPALRLKRVVNQPLAVHYKTTEDRLHGYHTRHVLVEEVVREPVCVISHPSIQRTAVRINRVIETADGCMRNM